LRRADIIAGSFLMLLAVYVIYAASLLPVKITGSGLGPGIVPMYLAALLAVLAAVLVFRAFIGKEKEYDKLEITRAELMGLQVVFLAQAIYIFSIKYLGFGTATFFFIAFLSNILGRYVWWKCGLFGLLVALIMVQVFRNMLGLPLLPGFTGF